MPKIIRNYAGTITIGKEDRSILELPRSMFDFEPTLGDMVDVYQIDNTIIVVKSMPSETANEETKTTSSENAQKKQSPRCKNASYPDNDDNGIFLLKGICGFLNPLAWIRFFPIIMFPKTLLGKYLGSTHS